jgi:signal transduction histidine kinase
MKIGGRVNMLIAVPLLALIATAVIGFFALQRVSVRGADYKALKTAQDLRSAVNPPEASLLEAWSEATAIGVVAASPNGFKSGGVAEIDRHLAKIASAKALFAASMTFWSKQTLAPTVQRDFVEIGADAASSFFDDVNNLLKPAIAAKDATKVLAAIHEMEGHYDAQQKGVDKALAWSNAEVVTHEANTDTMVRQLTLFGGAFIALLILTTLLLSVRVRRSIVRPIRALAAQAKRVASHDLAEAVATMHDLPSDASAPRLPEFAVETRDELADLAQSFTSVQDAAVDLAADQALARRTVSENLVNIARRSQTLLGRTLGFISTLEQTERDPEALDNLFRLDHLTTRMRRNAQSLLVLAGAEPTRLWSPPVPIGDVVRAALSEVENYGQVELADLGDVTVQGSMSADIAHLLAELLENATSFSPPSSPVTVVGRAVPDGHQLAIFDYGLGMTSEDLADANHRLNQVSSFDRDANKMLGFQVVARLAARHGVKVMLTTTPGGTGVTAIVRLPRPVLDVGTAAVASTPAVDLPAAGQQFTAPIAVPDPQPVPTVSFTPLTTEFEEEPAMAHAVSIPGPVAAVAAASAFTPLTSAPPMQQMHTLQPLQPNPAGAKVHDTLEQPVTTESSPSGLPKRVKGAQLPDLGSSTIDAGPVRQADEVRDTLASLQRGIDLGRQRGPEQ